MPEGDSDAGDDQGQQGQLAEAGAQPAADRFAAIREALMGAWTPPVDVGVTEVAPCVWWVPTVIGGRLRTTRQERSRRIRIELNP